MAAPNRNRPRWRPTPTRLVLAGLAACLGLELALRLGGVHHGRLFDHPLPPYGPLTNARQAAWLSDALADGGDGGGISIYDPQLGWTMAPGRSTADGETTINAAGMRGPREYAAEPPPGTLRVAAYGDSFTFGDEVPDTGAYPHLLEALAAARGAELVAYNFGLPGGGTDQALLRFRRTRERWPADVVAIGILLENIGRNVNRYRPRWTPYTGGPSVKPRFVLGADGALELIPPPVYPDRLAYAEAVADGEVWRATRTHDYWAGRPSLGPLRHLATARVGGFLLAQLARQPRRMWLDTEGEPFRTSVALLEAFHREALEAGARAAPVLIFPDADDVRGLRDDGERYWQGLLDALEARGIPALDLADPLLELSEEIALDTDLVGVYVSPKGHLAPAGNREVARVLLEWLEARGLLPGPSDERE